MRRYIKKRTPDMHITSSELTVERFWGQNKMLKICRCRYLKQYRNTIHSPWILKRLKYTEMHYVPLFTSDHVHYLSLFKWFISMHNNWPLILIKTVWFICINTVFAPHSRLQCSFVFKTPLGHVSHVYYVLR